MGPDSSAIEEITVAVTKSDRPDAHTARYDRQLRLWAAAGQSALENASILIVNGTSTAASTLKNLVLPGIGKFTIIDSGLVEGSDVGNNFFLEPSSIGKSRAEEVTKYLAELNGDVKGLAVVKDIGEILKDTPNALLEYSLIIAVDVNPHHILQLADIAWNNSIPFIKVKSCGFYGSLLVQLKELAIVETHPESLIDLRIHSPFPALIDYAKTFNYATMDSAEHGHVPAVVILIKALEDWRAANGGRGPSTTAERKTFTQSVMAQKRNSDEENFDEAVTLFRRAGTKNGVPSEIEALFNDPSCDNITASSPTFYLLLNAVKTFSRHSSHDSSIPQLPLSGVLPDMKADTQRYVGLQTIYRAKAKQDLALVEEILVELLAKLGLNRDIIGKEELETFVKHAGYLKVVKGRSLRETLESSKVVGQIEALTTAASYSEIPDDSLSVYLGLQASDQFFLKEGRYPGTLDSDTTGQADFEQMKNNAGEILKGLAGGEVEEELENVLHEICRSGASDLPQIAALIGGLVSQEAIKLITKQYVPLEGTCIFNGIRSTMSVVKA